jgi:hypothetical protein
VSATFVGYWPSTSRISTIGVRIDRLANALLARRPRGRQVVGAARWWQCQSLEACIMSISWLHDLRILNLRPTATTEHAVIAVVTEQAVIALVAVE